MISGGVRILNVSNHILVTIAVSSNGIYDAYCWLHCDMIKPSCKEGQDDVPFLRFDLASGLIIFHNVA